MPLGPLLLNLEDAELSELGVVSIFDKHKLKFELAIARTKVAGTFYFQKNNFTTSPSFFVY
jgi:hypothetical protein